MEVLLVILEFDSGCSKNFDFSSNGAGFVKLSFLKKFSVIFEANRGSHNKRG